MPTLAFEHVNLRFNPFGELGPEMRAAVAVVPPLDLAAGHVLQIMGEAGRGKTTHLLAWHRAAPGSVYEYVPEGQDRLRCSRLPRVCFVDEAQRLRVNELERLFAGVERLVLGTHEDLGRYAQRPVTTRVLSGIEVERLGRILSARIEAARRGAGPIPTIPRATLSRLAERFGDDLRSLERTLYEAFQRLEGPYDVEV